MAVDTNVSQLIINKMSAEQYKEAKESGTLSSTELYFVEEDAVVEGGGGGEGAGLWEHICDITVTEETSSVEVNQNSAGVPFAELRYNEFWVLAKMVGASTNTGTWWKVYGSTDDNRRINAAVSGGTTGIKYATWYLFIRGGKKYWNDGGINDPYCVKSGDQAWLDNFLDYYNSDHYVSLTIDGGTIGVDTEIRILGRRA